MKDKILHWFLSWFDSTWLWKFLLSKVVSKIHLRMFNYPLFPLDDFWKIVDLLDPKKHYVFLSTDEASLSSILIRNTVGGGLFSHAGVIVANGNDTSLIHVRDVGFLQQSFLSFLKEVDYLAIIELPLKDGSESIIADRISELIGKADQIEYDWEENLDNDNLQIYCSELIYDIFLGLVDDPDFTPRKIVGRHVFDPDRLLECGILRYTNHPKLMP